MQTKKGFRILDNGAAEGMPVEFRPLMDIAYSWQADEIVVPDAPRDFHETYDLALKFGQKLSRKVNDFRFGGVVQGRDLGEWIACINGFDGLDYITTLYLPRNMNDEDPVQRYFIARQIEEAYPKRFDAIHCLGSSAWTREAVLLSTVPQVRGMDTAMPVKLGLRNKWIGDVGTYDQSPNDGSFFNVNEITRSEELYIVRNRDTFHQWATSPSSDL